MRVANALLISPELTTLLIDRGIDSDEPVIKRVIATARQRGADIYLTVLTEQRALAALAKFGGPAGTSEPWRIIEPSGMHWPGGRVSLPTEWTLSKDIRQPVVDGVRSELSEGLEVEVCFNDRVLMIKSRAPLAADAARTIGAAIASKQMLVAADGWQTESFTADDGALATIAMPAAPSALWHDALFFAERYRPTHLAVVARDTELAAGPCYNFLEEMRRKAEGENDRVDEMVISVGADGTAASISELVFAPRISVPSQVHFVAQWNELNQQYVRRSYWTATRRAAEHLNEAAALLAIIDPKHFKRVGTLQTLLTGSGQGSVFDDYSGAVSFAPGHYEFELPNPDDPWRTKILNYFSATLEVMKFDRPLLKRRMFTNSLVILRSEVYYANLKEVPPWKKAEEYAAEAGALYELLQDAVEPIGQAEFTSSWNAAISGGAPTTDDWKLWLGLLDQVRNLGLVLLSVLDHKFLESGSREGFHQASLQSAVDLVRAYYAMLLGDTRMSGVEHAEKVSAALLDARAQFTRLGKEEEDKGKVAEWYEPGRPIRGWREADHPFENLLVGLLAAQRARGVPTAALGIFWGGVELPIVTDVAAGAIGADLVSYGFVRWKRYSKVSVPSRSGAFCDLKSCKFLQISALLERGCQQALLLDDNALSGATLESVRDLIYRAGLKTVETYVVRFSGERREGQIRMAEGGLVNPRYLSSSLGGYLGETLYARSYSHNESESPAGIFNVARGRVLRYLHNNGLATIFRREGF